MKKNRSKCITLLSVLILFTVWCVLFYGINTKFPQSKKQIYNSGDIFSYQEAEIQVIGGKFVSSKEIDKRLIESLRITDDKDLNGLSLILVDIMIYNPSDDTIRIDLTGLNLESKEFSMQFYMPLIEYYNGTGMTVELEPTEKRQMRLPVPANRNFFNEPQKTILENRDYYLVSSLYPNKTMSKIEFIK